MMKFMKVFLIVRLVGSLFESHHVMGTLPNVDYYLSLTEKDTPIFKCNVQSDGILYRIPPKRKCTLPDNPENSSAIDITLWWVDISHQEFQGYECHGLSRNVSCGWWLIKGTLCNPEEAEKIDITVEQCQQMIKTELSPDGDVLHKIQEGFWATENKKTPKGGWLVRETIVRRNFFY